MRHASSSFQQRNRALTAYFAALTAIDFAISSGVGGSTTSIRGIWTKHILTQALIQDVHLDQYLQCLLLWAVPENTILWMSSAKHMLKVVQNHMLEIKLESINAVNGSIGQQIHAPSQVSAAPTHQNISQPKQVVKSLTKRLLDRAHAKNTEFMTLIDRSPRKYAEGLYLRFMETATRRTPRGDDDELCQELLKIGELIKDVTMFEDRILNAAGIGDDLAEAQQIREGIQEVERWLEDILCGTLEGMDILMKAYHDQTLLYQCVAK
ncbi:hypothetical protein EDD18DRAFT_1359906 [Armillaria luteobubalina]|uniref:Uncharacterized protein n=1 Tax=Armillaria luteobubalina TaxID=153913 RepID=A0AA39UGB1_9AGAR|nr:hypothetical protein EDD18DRAFT_1359906 [Armillaria luteobubalina]